MGNSTYSHASYTAYRSTISAKSTNQLFEQNVKQELHPEMDPKGLTVRESRDSVAHPNTQAVIIGLDVTGSMGHIPEDIVRHKLDKLMLTLVNNGLPDVQILFTAIGDQTHDRCPLQVGQFESGDVELVKWLTQSYLERGGGGDRHESYSLAWLLGARHTAIDCFEKRNQKGVIITIGDEATHTQILGSTISHLFGTVEASTVSSADLLAEARKMYHVFHIHINEGSYPDDPSILDSWEKLLGMPPIVLHDYQQIAEVIATTIAMVNGVDVSSTAATFDDHTATQVTRSLAHLKTSDYTL